MVGNILFQFFLTISSFSQAYKFPHEEIIKEEITIEDVNDDYTLFVGNVSGSIDIEGYAGNTIKIELEKNIFSRMNKNSYCKPKNSCTTQKIHALAPRSGTG